MKCVLKMAELPLAAVTFSCLWRSWREQARPGQAADGNQRWLQSSTSSEFFSPSNHTRRETDNYV